MKRSPIVPSNLEAAVIKLAGQFRQKTHLNIVSESDQLYIHVYIQFGQVLQWQVNDYLYGIEHKAEQLTFTQAKLLARDGTILLFAWDSENGRLTKYKIDGSRASSGGNESSNVDWVDAG